MCSGLRDSGLAAAAVRGCFSRKEIAMSKSAAAVSHEDIDPESGAVHDWRVNRLTGLGLPGE